MTSSGEELDFEVWFAVDARTSECGFVAAASLLEHRPIASMTKIRVAYVQGAEPPANWWEGRLNKLQRKFDFLQKPLPLNDYAGCKGLFDSRAAFLRLVIPNFAESRLVVYSDADVVFQEDIYRLVAETDLGDEPIAMIRAGSCENQPERERILLEESGKHKSSDYFFSGLALINVKKYAEEKLVENCKNFTRKFQGKLDFHDQTIWNCAISKINKIDERWCHPAFPGCTEVPKEFKAGIVHFVGSPKPWDLLAELYHPYSKIWVDAARKAGLIFPRLRKYFQNYSWKRAWRIRKQYSVWFH